ncbi:MAG: hypothetical protein K0Q95_616 [Bacteroidota bacterium]|jgi:hypothetical protein|nr:hypothetical protein [Bacteroidota bacterium]
MLTGQKKMNRKLRALNERSFFNLKIKLSLVQIRKFVQISYLFACEFN